MRRSDLTVALGIGACAALLAAAFPRRASAIPAPVGPVFVTGPGAGAAPIVRLYRPPGTPVGEVATAAQLYGVRVAVGDVNGDGTDDLVTAPGAGGVPLLQVFSGVDRRPTLSLFAYPPDVRAGVFVAAGRIRPGLPADLVTGVDQGAPPHVKVFDGRSGLVLQSFFAFAPAFTGGVRVATGDVTGDGLADIVVGAGPGGGPHVKVFDGATLAEVRSFFAYDPGFAGGIFVAAGDVNGDGRADVITSTGATTSHVKAFSGVDGAELRSFFAYDPAFPGGVRVAAGDVNGDGVAEIVTGPGSGVGPHVKAFDGPSLGLLASFFAGDPSDLSGRYVALGNMPGLQTVPPPSSLPTITLVSMSPLTLPDTGGLVHVRVNVDPKGSTIQSVRARAILRGVGPGPLAALVNVAPIAWEGDVSVSANPLTAPVAADVLVEVASSAGATSRVVGTVIVALSK